MILWVDLLDKIDQHETQVTNDIGWQSRADLQRALRKLAAEAAGANLQDQADSDSYEMLQNCFGDQFNRIRLDLAEQRIVLDPTGDKPMPSREHIILGFALHFGAIATKYSTASVDDIADQLRAALEPTVSQDYLTEALFVALQLSAIPGRQAHDLSRNARAALLFVWISSQNAKPDDDRLELWAKTDLDAYLEFVEHVFLEPVSETWADRITESLKRTWKAHTHATLLEDRFRNWVKLMWRSHELPSPALSEQDARRLPFARTLSQLALSNAALAVVSERPDNAFLTDIAIASATSRLSRQRSVFRNPNTGAEQAHEIPCKDFDKNLGPVLRWRFTERIKPELELLRSRAESDKSLLEGVDSMIEAFDDFGLRWGPTYAECLRSRQAFFPASPEQNRNQSISCPEMAARDDLPSLNNNDQSVIAERVERAFESPELHRDRWQTAPGLDVEYYLPWFARFYPQRLAQLAADFRLRALAFPEPALPLHFVNALPLTADSISRAKLFVAAQDALNARCSATTDDRSWSVLEMHVLAFMCFDQQQLRDWLRCSAQYKQARGEIHYYPIPILSRYLLSDEVVSFIRAQVQRCCDDPPGESDHSQSEFDFWAVLAGTAGAPNLDYHHWVDAQLRIRHPSGHRRFYWRLLWFRTAPDSALESAVTDGSILELLSDDGLRAAIFAHRDISNWRELRTSLEAILKKVPLDDVGTLLLWANRRSELQRWANALFGVALDRI